MTSSLDRGTRLLEDRRVAEVLDRAPVLYSAVETEGGPHVTPTAFSFSSGAFWLVTTRDSMKVRALRRRPKVGLLLSSPRHDLVLDGTAGVVDPVRGRGVGLGRLVDLPFAAFDYAAGNYRHIAGILADAELGPGLVLDRVVVRIRPTRAALLRDHEVLASWGDWTSVRLLPDLRPSAEPDAAADPAHAAGWDLDALPAPARELLRTDGPACLAWTGVSGPLALPAWWPGPEGPIRTSAQLLTLVGGHRTGPAGLVRVSGGYRLAGKRGVLLRGTGRAAVRDDGALVTLRPERVTSWQGDRAGTVDVQAQPADRLQAP